ncbi:DotU family type IV/VI secretion system protein [Devosia soli]|uniref:DotU family type IV/VI secretion system protein n=1 Tax=Devosia soli TaxID=361041 RepID=UPI000AD36A36|nr:DotU family type IV/VI secretion system protein [Devosia soli]
MSDNVIKFRRPEKKPEPPKSRPPRGPMPNWVPFAVLVAVALVIYAVSQAGLFS